MRIAVGSDHAGFHLKEHVKAALTALGHDVVDVGPATPGSVDYPQFAADAARLVAAGDVDARRARLRVRASAWRSSPTRSPGCGRSTPTTRPRPRWRAATTTRTS